MVIVMHIAMHTVDIMAVYGNSGGNSGGYRDVYGGCGSKCGGYKLYCTNFVLNLTTTITTTTTSITPIVSGEHRRSRNASGDDELCVAANV